MEQPSAPQSGLRKEQKVGFALLLVFGVIAVVLGGLQLRNTIYGPFVVRIDSSERKDIERLFNNEEARLQRIDTDNDGLSDFEELSFYETSPYLPDSDSDGIDDAEEIELGTDPNCAEGKECAGVDDIQAPKTEIIESPLLNIQAPEQPTNSIFNLQDLVKDPSSLRKLLAQTGDISPEELAQIDDFALQQLAAELLSEQTATTTQDTPSVTTTEQ